MPPKKAATAPRKPLSSVGINSLIPSFFTPNKATSPAQKSSSATIDIDGIEELSESEFPAEDLARSAKRKKDRAAARAWKSRTSSVFSNEEVEHIDLSGPSSPPPQTPRRPQTRSTSSRMSSSPVSGVKRLRSRVTSSDEEPMSTKRKGKGKARAIVSDEDEPLTSTNSKGNTPAAGDTTDALDEPDEYDQYYDDVDYSALEWDTIDIPDFSELPSTFPHRSPSRSPTPVILVEDDEPTYMGEASPPVNVMADLKLVDDLDARLQAFYRDHWRRGADEEEEDDEVEFSGVEAVVKKRGGGGGRGRARGRGRGRGRAIYRKKR